MNIFAKSIIILLIDYGFPNIPTVLFVWLVLGKGDFSAIPEPVTRNQLHTRIKDLMILSLFSKICRSEMIVCRKYITFCWGQ
jgi:hypothetical protein